jgi:UDP-N-acetylenolpyruvoylglucosamine reductase
MCGGAGSPNTADLQQICPVQSLSCMHCLAHVAAQVPLQQSWPVWLQSEDVVQLFGQGSNIVLRHRPAVLSEGSTASTDVQHTSPDVVLQSVLVAHDLGHSFAGVQIACL